MSQEGIIDVINNNPDIPTEFVADVGSAVPIANVLEVLGDVVAAGTTPVYTSASGNTLVTNVQISQAIGATDVSKIGLSNFSSSHFAVDANGFVTLAAAGPFVTSVTGTANRITSTGGTTPQIDISASYVGQTSITTLGTIATGVWHGTAVDATHGGTNQTSWATGDILYASGVNTLAKLAAGSNTQVLTLAAGIPSWASPTTGTVTSVSGTLNRITSTGGATPVIDIDAGYVGQTSITTLGTVATGTWSATNIALNKGGTNASLTADNGAIFYSTASAGALLASTATANKALMSGASGAPTWSVPTFPNASATAGKQIRSDGTNWVAGTIIWGNALTTNNLLYASSTNTQGQITTANNGVLITSNSGVPSYLANGTVGQVLTANTGAPPSWTTAATSVVTANATAQFSGTTTRTLDFAITNLMLGSSGASIAGASNNVGFGFAALNGLTSGVQNTGVGYNALTAIQNGTTNTAVGKSSLEACTSGSNNTAVGQNSLLGVISGSTNCAFGALSLQLNTASDNCAFGYASANHVTSGTKNTAIGTSALDGGATGDNNTCLGYRAGFNYTTSDANNLCLGANVNGTTGESNVTRIGSGQTKCIVAGINGVTSSNPAVVTINTSTNQMGVDTANFTILSTGLQIKGNNTNTAPPAGFIGERISSAVASGSAVSVAINTATNITSISLTAGIWDVSCHGIFSAMAAANARVDLSISTTSATLGTDGDNNIFTTSAGGLGVVYPMCIAPYRILLSSTTTVYMVSKLTLAGAATLAYGRISATRVG